MPLCYYEGNFCSLDSCHLPITDLIIQRGVGVFDSIRSYSRKAFALHEHLDRLKSSADAAGIDSTAIMPQLPDIVRKGFLQVDAPNGRDLIARAFITGGDINNSGKFPHPRFFVIFDEGPEYDGIAYKNGIALHPAPIERPFPLVKSTNYLFGYMPSSGVTDVYESLYCPNGEITETLRGNFMLFVEGKLVTAPVGKVLSGVTRNLVVEAAKEAGYTVEERCPRVAELATASEAMLTSSWSEVTSVVRVGEQIIGDGQPGPVAKDLLKLFKEKLPLHIDQ